MRKSPLVKKSRPKRVTVAKKREIERMVHEQFTIANDIRKLRDQISLKQNEARIAQHALAQLLLDEEMTEFLTVNMRKLHRDLLDPGVTKEVPDY